MSKRKASLGLTTIIEDNIEHPQELNPVPVAATNETVKSKPSVKKKQWLFYRHVFSLKV